MHDAAAEFKVVYSETIRDRLKAICRWAVKAGRGDELLAAIEHVDQQLKTSPRDFGDPLFRLVTAQLKVYLRVYPPFRVAYAVHEQQPIVFIRDWKLYPENSMERLG